MFHLKLCRKHIWCFPKNNQITFIKRIFEKELVEERYTIGRSNKFYTFFFRGINLAKKNIEGSSIQMTREIFWFKIWKTILQEVASSRQEIILLQKPGSRGNNVDSFVRQMLFWNLEREKVKEQKRFLALLSNICSGDGWLQAVGDQCKQQ